MAGEDILGDPESHAARLVWVGHQDGIRAGLTPAETLDFWAAIGAPGPAGVTTSALQAFGLASLARSACRILSSGQRRRLALCRLLLRPAALWLLDEPTVGLDGEGQAALSAVIARHRATGGMAVLTSHQSLDLPDARHLGLGARYFTTKNG